MESFALILYKYMQKLLKPSKNLYKLLITALLVVIPLYPKFPVFSVPGTYVSIRLEDFLIGLSFVVFIPLIFKELKNLLANKIVRSIILFLFIGLVSLVSAIFLTNTVIPHIGFLHLIRRGEYFSLFVFGYLYLKNFGKKGDIAYFIKVLVLIIGFAFVYGLLQRYLSFPIIITQNYEYSKGVALRWIPGSHINSTFAGHYDLASYLVLVLPIFVSGFFVFKNKLTKIIFGLTTLFGFWLLSSAVSRISIVSFMVAVGIALLILKKYKEIIIFGLISVIIFGFSSSLRTRYMRIFDVIKEKVSSIMVVYAEEKEVFEDRSTSIRFNVEWPRAIRSVYKNPLLGTGYSSMGIATDNDFLRSLGEVGLLGTLALMLVLIEIIKRIFTFLKSGDKLVRYFSAGGISVIVAFLVNGLFIDVFEASKVASLFWLILGLNLAALNFKHD